MKILTVLATPFIFMVSSAMAMSPDFSNANAYWPMAWAGASNTAVHPNSAPVPDTTGNDNDIDYATSDNTTNLAPRWIQAQGIGDGIAINFFGDLSKPAPNQCMLKFDESDRDGTVQNISGKITIFIRFNATAFNSAAGYKYTLIDSIYTGRGCWLYIQNNLLKLEWRYGYAATPSDTADDVSVVKSSSYLLLPGIWYDAMITINEDKIDGQGTAEFDVEETLNSSTGKTDIISIGSTPGPDALTSAENGYRNFGAQGTEHFYNGKIESAAVWNFATLAAPPVGCIPIAEAGMPRYAATGTVTLDGSKSYDPDKSGNLTYQWTQLSGPIVNIVNAQTANPIVGPFTQIDYTKQECIFQLVVSDGVYTSCADTVKVVITASLPGTTMEITDTSAKLIPTTTSKTIMTIENPPFNVQKPTFVFFGGGYPPTGAGADWATVADCTAQARAAWYNNANILSWRQQQDDNFSTYYKWRHVVDLFLVYMSRIAPNYDKQIQVAGFSSGSHPAMELAVTINTVYAEPRYAVNHLTFLDGTFGTQAIVYTYLTSALPGEQCWLDVYAGTDDYFSGQLKVQVAPDIHNAPVFWYREAAATIRQTSYDEGKVGGPYWSVLGPGKNLQPFAWPAEGQTKYWYKVHNLVWTDFSNPLDFYDEALYPAKLPQPVTLLPQVGASLKPGIVFTCQPCMNVVGYQLLFGETPENMTYVVSDTTEPPTEPIHSIPPKMKYWTIKARDQYDSTIHANPVPIISTDINKSGFTDLQDYSLFAEQWLKTGCKSPDWCNGTDLDFDGTVSLGDLSLLIHDRFK